MRNSVQQCVTSIKSLRSPVGGILVTGRTIPGPPADRGDQGLHSVTTVRTCEFRCFTGEFRPYLDPLLGPKIGPQNGPFPEAVSLAGMFGEGFQNTLSGKVMI